MQTIDLPVNPIKNIVKTFVSPQISLKSILLLKNFIELLISDIAKQMAIEQNNINKFRQIQGLPPKKRLNSLAVERSIPIVIGKFYKMTNSPPSGSLSAEIVSPGGTNMKQLIEAAKSAKQKQRCRGDTDEP